MIALLSSITTETAVALGNLRRRGYAVTVILNLYEVHDFEVASCAAAGPGDRSPAPAGERGHRGHLPQAGAQGVVREAGE